MPQKILGSPAFLPELAAVSASGALVTLPARIAHAFASGFALVTAIPLVALRSFNISAYWHCRIDAALQICHLVDQAQSAGRADGTQDHG